MAASSGCAQTCLNCPKWQQVVSQLYLKNDLKYEEAISKGAIEVAYLYSITPDSNLEVGVRVSCGECKNLVCVCVCVCVCVYVGVR